MGAPSKRTDWGAWIWGALLGVVLLSGFTGCGEKATTSSRSQEAGQPNGRSQETQQTNPSESARQTDSGQGSETQETAGPARTDSDGRKWIENIPYDVWFDDPIAVANNSQAVADASGSNGPPESITLPQGSNDGPKTESGSAAPDDSGAADSSGPSATDWKALVPAAVLDAEVKHIRNRMTQAMQTVGKYNAHYKEIERDGTTLAAVAAIAHQHPESLRWKEHALYLRDFGTAIADSATALGRKAFEATLQPYEQFVGILNGSQLAVESEPDPDADLTFTVYRSGVMQRMEQAFKGLKSNAGSKQTLLAKRDNVLHEAGILTAFGKLIAHPDYPSAGDPEYTGYAKELVQAGLDIRKSVEEESYDGFQNALNRVQQSCNDCHADYRFSGDL